MGAFVRRGTEQPQLAESLPVAVPASGEPAPEPPVPAFAPAAPAAPLEPLTAPFPDVPAAVVVPAEPVVPPAAFSRFARRTTDYWESIDVAPSRMSTYAQPKRARTASTSRECPVVLAKRGSPVDVE